jgi:dihydrofolate reductase
MARVIAGMTLSLDGFVADRNGSADVLYPDLEALRGTPYMESMIAETGAVVMGRRAFAMAEDPDYYVGNYELQVPIFVVTHQAPEKHPAEDEHLTFTFVTDGAASAVAQAKVAAKDRDVTVIGGASTIRQLLDAALVDELRIDVMPVLLGEGLPLFTRGQQRHLEKISVEEIGARTSLRFRMRH